MAERPVVFLDEWKDLTAMRPELHTRLMCLALKSGRRVECHQWNGNYRYSKDVIHVFICCKSDTYRSVQGLTCKLGDTEYKLPPGIHSFSSAIVDDGDMILDDSTPAVCLAMVHYNNIIILHSISAVDCPASREIMSRCMEYAPKFLNFDVQHILDERRDLTASNYLVYYRAAFAGRLQRKQEQVRKKRDDLEIAYKNIISLSRDLPVDEAELSVLSRMYNDVPQDLIDRQVKILHKLIDDGLYQSITPCPDGTLNARTCPIYISALSFYKGTTKSYNNVPMGSYDLIISPTGQIKVYSVDGMWAYDKEKANKVCHPHVDAAGNPCLGNILPSVAKALGAMRIGESLLILHGYLQSYYEEGAHAYLSEFAESNVEPACPGADCPGFRSPFCVVMCAKRATEKCSDFCREYRTDWCYLVCPYNERKLTPCDACQKAYDNASCTACRYNANWTFHAPCDNCDEYVGADCAYYKTAISLERIPAECLGELEEEEEEEPETVGPGM